MREGEILKELGKKNYWFFFGGGDTLYLNGFALDWDCLPLPKNWKLPLVPFRVLLVSRGQTELLDANKEGQTMMMSFHSTVRYDSS